MKENKNQFLEKNLIFFNSADFHLKMMFLWQEIKIS